MSWLRRRAAALVVAFSLVSGCAGFEPLYEDGSAASRIRHAVAVEASGEGLGFEIERAAAKRLGAPFEPRYIVRAGATMAESEAGVGGQAGFERIHLDGAARFDVLDIASGELLYKGAVSGSASYSSTRETFHTLTARRDARRRLGTQLGERIARPQDSTAAGGKR